MGDLGIEEDSELMCVSLAEVEAFGDAELAAVLTQHRQNLGLGWFPLPRAKQVATALGLRNLEDLAEKADRDVRHCEGLSLNPVEMGRFQEAKNEARGILQRRYKQ